MGSEDGTLHRHFDCFQLEIINAIGKQRFHSSINVYLVTVQLKHEIKALTKY